MDVVCISTSNMIKSGENSTSYRICKYVTEIADSKGMSSEIIDLREYEISPCIGCGKCFDSKRCISDPAFNEIYKKIVDAKYVFIVSPHYAPIPAKLCMLLEKMEQITFLHWWKDNTYQSEVNAIPTGIISHGGAPDWALKSYKEMVNDTIANALDTIQLKLIPYNAEWNTGISIPVEKVIEEDSIFPIQTYNWDALNEKLREYIELVMK